MLLVPCKRACGVGLRVRVRGGSGRAFKLSGIPFRWM